MEILKRFILSTIIILLVGNVFAQSNAVLQKAFRTSYADESNKNYAGAITDIMPYYEDNNYEVNVRLGWLHYMNKNYTASQSYYSKAIGLRQNAIEPKFGIVKPLSYLQNWDKVLQQYLDILKIDPQNTQANYWAGMIYYNRKQFPTAMKYFKVVVTLYPFDYDSNHMLAWATLLSGRKDEAKISFQKALIIKPDDESSTDGLNRCK